MTNLNNVCWNITSACNENCKFCFRKKCPSLSLEENKLIFDNFNQVPIKKLTISGGEALLYEDLFPLLNYIKEKNPTLTLSLTTNGKIVDDYLIDQIIKIFDIVTLSLDSITEGVNEKIGRGKNHLSKIIAPLDSFNNQIIIKVNTVASLYNIKELENIYNLINNYNISRWKILRYYPIRDGQKYKDEFYLDDNLANTIYQLVEDLSPTSNILINYDNTKEFKTSYFIIYPDGSIEDVNGIVIGNLLENDINEILSKLPMQSDISKREELTSKFLATSSSVKVRKLKLDDKLLPEGRKSK